VGDVISGVGLGRGFRALGLNQTESYEPLISFVAFLVQNLRPKKTKFG